jgi:hypothetical protein
VRLLFELRRAHIGYPDLNRPEALGAKSATVLAYSLSHARIFVWSGHELDVTCNTAAVNRGSPRRRLSNRAGRRSHQVIEAIEANRDNPRDRRDPRQALDSGSPRRTRSGTPTPDLRVRVDRYESPEALRRVRRGSILSVQPEVKGRHSSSTRLGSKRQRHRVPPTRTVMLGHSRAVDRDGERPADLLHALVTQATQPIDEHTDGNALDRVEVDRAHLGYRIGARFEQHLARQLADGRRARRDKGAPETRDRDVSAQHHDRSTADVWQLAPPHLTSTRLVAHEADAAARNDARSPHSSASSSGCTS